MNRPNATRDRRRYRKSGGPHPVEFGPCLKGAPEIGSLWIVSGDLTIGHESLFVELGERQQAGIPLFLCDVLLYVGSTIRPDYCDPKDPCHCFLYKNQFVWVADAQVMHRLERAG